MLVYCLVFAGVILAGDAYAISLDRGGKKFFNLGDARKQSLPNNIKIVRPDKGFKSLASYQFKHAGSAKVLHVGKEYQIASLKTQEGVAVQREGFMSKRRSPLMQFGDGEYVWPVDLDAKQRISSEFGYRRDPMNGRRSFHSGVDIAAASGTQVLAAKSGKVIESGRHPRLGRYIKLEHPDNTATVYGHLSAATITQGEKVRAGEIIGLVGSSGRSTGAHLHFTLLENGEQVDPMTRLEKPAELRQVRLSSLK